MLLQQLMGLKEVIVIYVELEFVFHQPVAVKVETLEDLAEDLVFMVDRVDLETKEDILL